MPTKRLGDPSLQLQPGWSITRHDDGTITGQAVFHGSAEYAALGPRLGGGHPKQPGLECTSITVTSDGLNQVTFNCAYFGIGNDTRRVNYSPGSASEDIQLHPRFKSVLAGSPENPKYGAVWEKVEENGITPEHYRWLGFFEKDGTSSTDTINTMVGTTHFLTNSGTVEVSYYTKSTPKMKKLNTIHSRIKGFSKPGNIKNFLLHDMPYRQIGASHYQVTEVYLCSDERGWNVLMYEQG